MLVVGRYRLRLLLLEWSGWLQPRSRKQRCGSERHERPPAITSDGRARARACLWCLASGFGRGLEIDSVDRLRMGGWLAAGASVIDGAGWLAEQRGRRGVDDERAAARGLWRSSRSSINYGRVLPQAIARGWPLARSIGRLVSRSIAWLADRQRGVGAAGPGQAAGAAAAATTG